MLSADDVRQLEALTFSTAGAAPSSHAGGARVARVQGFSTEFHDFRPYQTGDDPRAIEWTIYGRLGQLVTRTSRTTAHLHLHLLVDTSASMSVGTPAKLHCAVRVAALLAYVALRTRDAVGLAMFRDRVEERLAPAASRAQVFRIFAALERATPSGASAIGTALMNYAEAERGPGLAVVISDFFDPSGVIDGLRHLQHRGLTPVVVEVVADEDVEPDVSGDVELVDVEAPDAEPRLVSTAAVTAYKAALAEDRAALRHYCDTQGLAALHLRSSAPFTEMLNACASAGLFQR
jgi:uncharacterized protein (DUF58 family)